jgi:hypothetical protein
LGHDQGYLSNFLIAALSIFSSQQEVPAIKQTRFEIEYQDACNHFTVAGKHTSEYLSGYAASSKDCGNSNLPTDNSQVQGQSSNINPQCRLLCAGSSSSSQAQAGAR